MAETYSFSKLDGSTSGEPVLVSSTGPTGSNGQLIHTIPTGKRGRPELWAVNNSANLVRLTLQFGTNLSTKELSWDIPPKGSEPVLVSPGVLLESSAFIRAFASVIDTIVLFGSVNTQTTVS